MNARGHTSGLPTALALLFTLLTANASVATVRDTNTGLPLRRWSGKTILIISPHPDDDIIGCGGALALLGGRDNRLVVAY